MELAGISYTEGIGTVVFSSFGGFGMCMCNLALSD